MLWFNREMKKLKDTYYEGAEEHRMLRYLDYEKGEYPIFAPDKVISYYHDDVKLYERYNQYFLQKYKINDEKLDTPGTENSDDNKLIEAATERFDADELLKSASNSLKNSLLNKRLEDYKQGYIFELAKTVFYPSVGNVDSRKHRFGNVSDGEIWAKRVYFKFMNEMNILYGIKINDIVDVEPKIIEVISYLYSANRHKELLDLIQDKKIKNRTFLRYVVRFLNETHDQKWQELVDKKNKELIAQEQREITEDEKHKIIVPEEQEMTIQEAYEKALAVWQSINENKKKNAKEQEEKVKKVALLEEEKDSLIKERDDIKNKYEDLFKKYEVLEKRLAEIEKRFNVQANVSNRADEPEKSENVDNNVTSDVIAENEQLEADTNAAILSTAQHIQNIQKKVDIEKFLKTEVNNNRKEE